MPFHRLANFACLVAVSLITLNVAHAEDAAVVTVTESGTAILGDGTKSQVKEKAKNDAIRKAVELVSGVEIVASSEVNNFELVSDVVKTYTAAYVKSIKELSYTYNPATEEGVFKGEFKIDKQGASSLAAYDNHESRRLKADISATLFFFNQYGAVIEDASVVRSGDQFNIFLQPATDMYVNIINRDTKGNMFRIFPNSAVSSEANPLQSGSKYYFPPKNSDLTFAFDSATGTEAFYFVLSETPLQDLDVLFSQMGNVTKDSERTVIADALEARVKTRGISLSTKSGQVVADHNDVSNKSQEHLIEQLQGKGAVLKIVNLHHVQ